MSQVFGDIRQLAFVVDDIDIAMNYWANVMGIGPFFVKRGLKFSEYCYQGQEYSSPYVSIALANSGYIQIELIQQHDHQPSIYLDALQQHQGRSYLQHVSSWLTTENLLEKRSELVSKGYDIAQECVIASSGVRLVYFQLPDGLGSFIFEMSDLLEPEHYERVLGIKSAYDYWDGVEEPIRDVTK